MKKLIRSALRSLGIDLVRYVPDEFVHKLKAYPDLTVAEKQILLNSRDYTMTGLERMSALLHAVKHLTENKVPGDIAECGVWRGGSMMVVAQVLVANKDTDRILYLYDTFEGMSEPTDADLSWDGREASTQLKETPRGTGVWCEASLEDVRANMLSTGYPEDKIRFIKGKVEDTIPKTLPEHLALLRLDTDWYESTRHELLHLYPLLDERGLLILDDYGHWQGVRKAVDEYFQETGEQVYLHRIDYSARVALRYGSAK